MDPCMHAFTNATDVYSPIENARKLYEIMGQGTEAFKFIKRKKVDLAWRNPVCTRVVI